MSWQVVARKEFTQHVRNYWIIAMTAVFLSLTLLASGIVNIVLTLDRDVSFSNIHDTVGTMRFVAAVLLPIIALMLGHATLAGERESGSLALLVAQPTTRARILVGKYVGLFAVLAVALVAGVGLGGLVVVLGTRGGVGGLYVLVMFMLETLLWGAAWMSITLLISAYFVRRTTAIAGSLLIWFLFSIIWVPITVLAVALARPPTNVPVEAPLWLLAFVFLNPNSLYGGLASTTIGGYPGIIGAAVGSVLPFAASALAYGIALVVWVLAPLGGAYALFRMRDV